MISVAGINCENLSCNKRGVHIWGEGKFSLHTGSYFTRSKGIYTSFYIINTVSYKSMQLPLQLERVGERGIKSTVFIPLIPAFFLKEKEQTLV